jgi:hypothetical protein
MIRIKLRWNKQNKRYLKNYDFNEELEEIDFNNIILNEYTLTLYSKNQIKLDKMES